MPKHFYTSKIPGPYTRAAAVVTAFLVSSRCVPGSTLHGRDRVHDLARHRLDYRYGHGGVVCDGFETVRCGEGWRLNRCRDSVLYAADRVIADLGVVAEVEAGAHDRGHGVWQEVGDSGVD